MRFQNEMKRFRLLPALLALLLTGLRATDARAGLRAADYGADAEIGGVGTGNGKFAAIAAMAFDANNNLYVLDTAWSLFGKTRSNYLIQRFTDSGQFVSQYSIYDARLGANNAPEHIALDSQGNLYLTQPRAGLVQQYNANGVRVRDFALPGAAAVATRVFNHQEQILVLPRPNGQSVQQVSVYYADGRTGTPIRLSRAVSNVSDLAADSSGCLYALADVNQVYKFDPNGVLLTVLGSGISGASQINQTDGSVLANAARVDSKGAIYSLTPGNPGFLTKFSADLATETQRPGLFSWCDAWTYCNYYGPSYAPIAVDRKDRVWVGVNGTFADGELDYGNPMHFRPCVFRVASNFLTPGQAGVTQNSALALGLLPALSPETSGSTNEYHALNPQVFTLAIAAATRRVSTATLNYVVYDTYKNGISQGNYEIPLTDNVVATKRFVFQAPKWGWYEMQYTLSSGGNVLKSGVMHLGYSPDTPNLPTVPDSEIKPGPVDAARQAETQLQLIRTGVGYGLDAVEQHVSDAAKYGLTLLVSLTYTSDCAPDAVRQAVTRFKGRVRYWEVVNEPNLSMSPESYVTLLKQTYAQIKSIDPQAQVVAPALCGIDLNWFQRFYQLGGKNYCDVLSLHDYEGHESIDPYHWTYKINALRQIMTAYGDTYKPIWQTERAISGVRGGGFTGGAQAVRMLLHRDVLESLGISADRNLHFYPDAHGFSLVPSYLWSGAGPHPAAIALRARAALLKGRLYAGTLDFGVTGNKLYFGVKYQGADGAMLSLHNLGLPNQAVTFRVTGASSVQPVSSVQMMDAYNNVSRVAVIKGLFQITLPALPVYLYAPNGQTIAPVPLNFGRNQAGAAQFAYSESSNGNFGALTNGVMESIHQGAPNPNFWVGDMPANPNTAPILTVTFPTPRTVSKAILYSINADNYFSALLDYDAQAWNGTDWVTVASVHTPCPASDPVASPDCLADTWYLDQNMSMAQFPPVTTSKMRFVAKRVTAGFLPDAIAAAACQTTWGGVWPRKLMLREIEIY